MIPNIILRAEQSRAEQSRAEQSRAEQSRAEQRVTSCFFCVIKLYKVRGDPLPSGYG